MESFNALQDAGKTDVYVIGYDATEEQKELMVNTGEDCRLYASPGMSSVKMAVKCVEFMEQILNGEYTRSGPEDIFEFKPELLTVVSGLNTANGRPMMEGDIIWDGMNDIERSYPAEIMFLSGPKRSFFCYCVHR